ncbi:hypothetical protein PNIG_a0498 [Pseudoalteromonas nigrifaciens]|uniref:O-antigen transporter n=1 Tax=Pseudoalteromonas nigrifaciens TaxID=28109 RepID=A0AAC9UFM5_9GAMM|nr:flippase [Pseudoalteromonas nigrifaciens]ASM52808.1 hypothetical protein PNIG_a0498 [Pseudoalteromonas nigrifaciens]GEN43178.1 polysaccharide biosynthesis protein [Pseudoalteromonas nigrifaciens]SUC53315.1 Putative O-antigen transporter [Pseudoalteromonas nigrifaciens]
MFDLKKVKNLIFNALYYLLNMLFPLITFPYISRILGVEGVGAASLALTTATYFTTIASLGIPIYGIREVARCLGKPERLNYVVSELMFINAISAFISLLLYFIVINSINIMSDNITLYYIAAINIVLSFFQIDWLFQGLEKFKILAIRSFITKLLSITLVFTLVLDSDDVEIYVLISVIALSIANIINIFSAKKIINFKYKNLKFKKHLKPIVYFLSTRLMSTVYTLLDSVILGIMTSNYFVGLYTTAIRLVRVITTLISSATTVFFAEASRLAEDKSIKYQALLLDLFIFLLMLSLPIAIFTSILSDELIYMFAGKDFMSASLALKITSGLIVISTITNFTGVQILYSNKLEKKVAESLGVGAFVCIVMNLSLIPIYQHNGAAIAALSAEFSIMLYQFYVIYKAGISFSFIINLRFLKLSSACAIYCILVLVCYELTEPLTLIVRFVILTLFSLIIYPIILFVFKDKLLVDIFSKIKL